MSLKSLFSLEVAVKNNKRFYTFGKYLVSSIAIFLIFCAVYFLLSPKINEFNGLKKELNEVHNEWALYEKLYRKYLEYNNITAQYNELIKRVPINNDLTKFIYDIEEWAEQNDVLLISIVPQETTTERIKEIDVNIIPCEITINGDFDLLLSFISMMENYPRICRIKEIYITSLAEKNLYYPFAWKLTVIVSLYYIPAPIT